MDQLRRSIPLPRIARYDDACRFADVDGMELYRWATSVALAVFDDIGHVEVAMRSAMARELANVYGLEWFKNRDILDQDALDRIGEAVTRTRLYKLPPNPDLRHGKLVASMTFGFWVKLVGRGGYAVIEGEEFRRIYDTAIWKEAVRKAFPNVGDTDRKRVEVVARHVNALRNRIAHHEHIVWGVPMAGEVTDNGKPLRLSLSSAHQAVLELASFLDHDLAEWIRQNTTVQARINECPIYPLDLFLVDQHT